MLHHDSRILPVCKFSVTHMPGMHCLKQLNHFDLDTVLCSTYASGLHVLIRHARQILNSLILSFVMSTRWFVSPYNSGNGSVFVCTKYVTHLHWFCTVMTLLLTKNRPLTKYQ